jgi:hypothetical protein
VHDTAARAFLQQDALAIVGSVDGIHEARVLAEHLAPARRAQHLEEAVFGIDELADARQSLAVAAQQCTHRWCARAAEVGVVPRGRLRHRDLRDSVVHSRPGARKNFRRRGVAPNGS